MLESLVVLLWLIGAGVTLACLKPDTAADGAFVLLISLFIWPLVAIGWLVSRPWA